MHHIRIDQWSRLDSPLHRAEPRAKVVCLFAYLVILSTLRPGSLSKLVLVLVASAVLLEVGVFVSKLPTGLLELRAGVTLPFSFTFALLTWLGGDLRLAISLLVKSYLSSLAALLVVGTTTLPDLLQALERLGAPSFLVMVVQFLYRYLFLVADQAARMRLAAKCRGGDGKGRLAFRAAAGAVSVLFARSYSHAEGIFRAMLARGFTGRFPAGEARPWKGADFLLIGAVSSAMLALSWFARLPWPR